MAGYQKPNRGALLEGLAAVSSSMGIGWKTFLASRMTIAFAWSKILFEYRRVALGGSRTVRMLALTSKRIAYYSQFTRVVWC